MADGSAPVRRNPAGLSRREAVCKVWGLFPPAPGGAGCACAKRWSRRLKEGDGEEERGARRPSQTRPPAAGYSAASEDAALKPGFQKAPVVSTGCMSSRYLSPPNCVCGLLALYLASLWGLYVPGGLCGERSAARCCATPALPSLGSGGSGCSSIRAVCAGAAAAARAVPETPRCPRALGALRGTLGVCPSSCFKYTSPAGCCNSEVNTDTNKRRLTSSVLHCKKIIYHCSSKNHQKHLR